MFLYAVHALIPPTSADQNGSYQCNELRTKEIHSRKYSALVTITQMCLHSLQQFEGVDAVIFFADISTYVSVFSI